ncbi:SDR family NAD(P)-dependent oxidoreductase [Arvimicrobium flavum]|uniref:SDR family NAD(P)-dependent oxidoreductase n=1 Tax=Arvimicrobium flavum TaxID=3393320 RepID=UPI00237BA6AB|nr:SDR family NAD(P)-dependent oxidoreductase [Mesorhizobium shangrilense]
MPKLAGKTALVTGGARGIGRALALKLAAEGAHLVINDLDAAPLAETGAEIETRGGTVATLAGSVTEDGFAESFVDLALQRFGGIDIIVNNAGYTWLGTAAQTSDTQLEAMLRVHVMAPFRLLRAAHAPIRQMHERERAEGREVFRKVVNISSMAGTGGVAGQFAYSTAKAGLIGVTRTLCREWGRLKVNVNCVAYGLIETRLNMLRETGGNVVRIEGHEIELGLSRRFKENTEAMIPLGRIGTAEEAADGAYLFCIPESNYVSGQVVTVSGGLSI